MSVIDLLRAFAGECVCAVDAAEDVAKERIMASEKLYEESFDVYFETYGDDDSGLHIIDNLQAERDARRRLFYRQMEKCDRARLEAERFVMKLRLTCR